eukprot:CAMPEP_0183469688 /NCGR_PEP_ID=MMETSP0370-20130417/154931_1 /TAXON_ID=268820 /ORGANISM="Peridinium aciculiferum, Strain PAER-2" /LENGTH=45 /DNA_ID= /DNA_START= /DNA_END= /DNA_ORIENTATION=
MRAAALATRTSALHAVAPAGTVAASAHLNTACAHPLREIQHPAGA